MSGCSKLIVSACLAASASWFAGSAGAAPAQPGQLLQGDAALSIEQVQMRDQGGRGRGAANVNRSGGQRFSGRSGGGDRWSGNTGTRWSGGNNWRGRDGNWSGRRWAGRGNRGWGPGVSVAIAAPYYGAYAYDYYGYDDYAYDNGYVAVVPDSDADAVAYCMQRFRSYDPASGTYLGYDGLRHPCP